MSARNEPGCLSVIGYLGFLSAVGIGIAYAPEIFAFLTTTSPVWARWALAVVMLAGVVALIVWAALDSADDGCYCAEADVPPPLEK